MLQVGDSEKTSNQEGVTRKLSSKLFDLFDENKDGKVDVAELALGLKAIGENPDKASEVLSKIDKNNDGKIDIEEFFQGLDVSSNIEKKLEKMFEHIDKDKNGFVSATEVLRAWQELGESLCDDQVDEIIRTCDVDGDGKIGRDEFVRTFKNKNVDNLDMGKLWTANDIQWNQHGNKGVCGMWSRVDHIALIVSDVGRSAEFYGQTLGMQQVYRPDFDRYGAWFTLKNVELHLIKGRPCVHADEDLIVGHIAFNVGTNDDFQRFADRLTLLGLKFRENLSIPNPPGTDSKSIRQAFVRDPDGYYIEFGSCDSIFNPGTKKDGGLDNLDLNSIAISLEMKKLAATLKAEMKQIKKTFDTEKLEKLLQRQKTFGDITQSASEEQLKDLLIMFDNDIPSVISGIKFLISQTGGQIFIPPAFIDRDDDRTLTQPPNFKMKTKQQLHMEDKVGSL